MIRVEIKKPVKEGAVIFKKSNEIYFFDEAE
jgi:hypothetical protein